MIGNICRQPLINIATFHFELVQKQKLIQYIIMVLIHCPILLRELCWNMQHNFGHVLHQSGQSGLQSTPRRQISFLPHLECTWQQFKKSSRALKIIMRKEDYFHNFSIKHHHWALTTDFISLLCNKLPPPLLFEL